MEGVAPKTTGGDDVYVAPKLSTDQTWQARMDAAAAEYKRSTEKSIQEAIRDSPEKEPFDYPRFTQLYWRKDVLGDVSPDDSPEVQAEYRQKYYLDFRNLQTMEEFARSLEDLDARAGN